MASDGAMKAAREDWAMKAAWDFILEWHVLQPLSVDKKLLRLAEIIRQRDSGREIVDREAVAPLREALKAMVAHEVYEGICHACGNGAHEHMPGCVVLKAEAALRGGGD